MQRFMDSIEYIEANLFEKITPDDIARQACFSTFHYCRMFRALIGDSVMGYVRKRRLSVAALRLASEKISIVSLALDCQFESHEAFTRAFKQLFHITPSEFKSLPNPIWPGFKKPVNPQTLHHLREGGVSMVPEIVRCKEFLVTGISSNYTQTSTQDIPLLWQQFGPRIESIAGRTEAGTSYGICRPVHNGEFEYTAAVAVNTLDNLPEGMSGIVVPEQTYARFTHRGAVRDIHETISYIWATWFPNSDFDVTGKTEFEQYDKRFDPVGLTGEIDFYVPVTEKTTKRMQS